MPENTEDLRRLQADTQTGSAGWQPAGASLVPGLTVLYHPDLRRVGERAALMGLAAGREELLSRVEPPFAPPDQLHQRPLADLYLSRVPLRLVPMASAASAASAASPASGGGVRLVCGASRTGVRVDGVPVTGEHAISSAEVEHGVVLLLAERVVLLLSLIDPLSSGPAQRFGLVGESPPLLRLVQEVRRVADLDVPVLLRGETGTGKELVARALHQASPRRQRPYLAVNMAAVPVTLAAAELFGAARGAFTGADRERAGYFSRAQHGTLFLDEVGDTPFEVQALLLRALEAREIQPVGGGEPVKVDVRLLAATDADLESAVAAGRFRAPLLHRLAGYEILVPPLRDRREDFGRLFVHFLREELEEVGEAGRLEPAGASGRPWVPAGLVARLALHDWPGNVRQLRNVVRHLVISGRGSDGVQGGPRLEKLLRAGAGAEGGAGPSFDSETSRSWPGTPSPRPRKSYRRPEEVGEDEMLDVLRANRWRLQPSAAALGISRTSLYERIEKSPRIRKAADLGREEIEECAAACQGDLDAMVERLEVSKRGLQRQMKRLGLLAAGDPEL